MKIFSKEQMREGDKITTERQGISFNELMERAGTQIFNWLHTRMQGAQVPIHVFCGIGNNGGDGLVIARHLVTHGYNVHTYVVNCSDKRSKDFLINYDRIKNVTKKWPLLLTCKEEFPEIHHDDIIVDCVFGIGLNRPVDDWVKQLFQHFRASKAFTLAVDMPSGLFSDKVPKDEDGVVYANHTLSFQSPKLVFFLPQTAKYTLQWEVLDIGIDPEYLFTTETDAELIGKFEVLPMYRPRDRFSHKGTFGHALIIGGSYGKMGAVILAGRGAMAAGAGLLTNYIPRCGNIILQTALPEAMAIMDADEEVISDISFEFEPTVIGMGMGMGTSIKTATALEAFLKTNKTPLVVDADALNIVSKKKTLLKLIPENSILTPHAKELERLVGKWSDDFDKLERTKTLAKKYKLVIVIKGANTITVFDDRLHINSSGNPALATAGSGDVLTGIITGLRAQGYSPVAASVFGVYLHGVSADIGIADHGYEAFVASDIIGYLGEAYKDLFKREEQPPQEAAHDEQE